MPDAVVDPSPERADPSPERADPSPERADRRLERAARRWTGDPRTARQLREHYAIERRLADRLREASPAERSALYTQVYEELFRSIPHHPQLRRRASAERAARVDRELYFLAPLLHDELALLEIGAGDLALSERLAGLVGEVHAVDVASEIASGQPIAANLHIHLTDGRHLPLGDESVGLAYSNQLMEHLHPDDALEQLREIFRVIAPGGHYLCVTPNALTGPWDISRLFSSTPTGLHLREYSNRELVALFGDAGFEYLRVVVPAGANARSLPVALFTAPEWALQALAPRARRALLCGPWRKPLNSIRLLARKPEPRRRRRSTIAAY
jgi:SAM-dependent methyltransferase